MTLGNPLDCHLTCACHLLCFLLHSPQSFSLPLSSLPPLQGEDVVRSSGVPFAVVRPVALTEEPAGAELQLDQGDTIKVCAGSVPPLPPPFRSTHTLCTQPSSGLGDD